MSYQTPRRNPINKFLLISVLINICISHSIFETNQNSMEPVGDELHSDSAEALLGQQLLFSVISEFPGSPNKISTRPAMKAVMTAAMGRITAKGHPIMA